jgi:hypothetical protein
MSNGNGPSVCVRGAPGFESARHVDVTCRDARRPTRSLCTGEIERAAINQLRAILRAPEFLAQTYRAARAQADEHISRLSRTRTEAEATIHTLREEVARAAAGDNGRSGPVSGRLFELQTQITEQELVLARAKAEIERLGPDRFTEREVAERH